jgi:hypothetical protein
MEQSFILSLFYKIYVCRVRVKFYVPWILFYTLWIKFSRFSFFSRRLKFIQVYFFFIFMFALHFSFLLLCISSTTSACFEDEDERGTRNEREMESQLQLWLKDIFVLFGRRFYVIPKQHNSQYKMNKIRCSRIDKIMKMYECEIFLMQKENSTEKKTIYSNANRT